MKKTIVFTNVYNGEKTVAQTIESVLRQTYPYFEYHIVENGSTDRTREIIESFAKEDPRIIIHIREKNHRLTGEVGPLYPFLESLAQSPSGYVTAIDADDWWDDCYLERMIRFLEENDLDLAITGTMTHYGEGEKIFRSVQCPVVLPQNEFVKNYPSLWTFPSTYWGNIMKQEKLPFPGFKMPPQLVYGEDTLFMLAYLSSCNRIGIDNSTMYHYRIHPQGVSYQYDPRRFDANVVYYEAIRDFLKQHNTFDAEKQEWLKRVHIASMQGTLNLLYESSRSIQEKLAECIRIIEHPLTAYVLTADCDEQKAWYHVMHAIISRAVGGITSETEDSQLRQLLRFIAPACAEAFSSEYVRLYAAESAFWTALLMNDRETAMSAVMGWITQRKYTKQFDLGKLLNRLIPDGFLLKDECDTRFFKTYDESCRLIFKNDLNSALEKMTGVLLEKDTLYAEERFLKLYLSIAALQNQIPAFLYGNIRLAYLYFNENRVDDCRGILCDLEDMGAGEHEDVLALRQALEKLR